jgi:DNA-binding cell septation regulator SpoVG
VVRNLKIIQGNSGLFVAMPSRKAVDACPRCRHKNTRGSQYCNACGCRLERRSEEAKGEGDRSGDHMDIAHPITQECREYIQKRIIEAYDRETGGDRAEPGGREAVSSPSPEVARTAPERPSAGSAEPGKAVPSAPEVEEGRDIEL